MHTTIAARQIAIASARIARADSRPDLRCAALLAKLPADVRFRIESLARQLTAGPVPSEEWLKQVVSSQGRWEDMDVEEAIFVVMMTLAREAQKAVQEILADVRRTAAAKAAARAHSPAATMQGGPSGTLLVVNRQIEDDVSQLGGEAQLRLQIAMERLAQAMALLSNVMEKSCRTAAAIADNVK
ncbi:MAG TPA: hypothetical protein VEL28_20800 [Candidatus Binatia bacterium]|nr:hypothetical protein [Candidatus Binatia bacterium]